jgi:hypothetical protein
MGGQEPEKNQDEEEEFSFRLFSTSVVKPTSAGASSLAKITIRSPSPEQVDTTVQKGRKKVVPHLARKLTLEEKQQILESAVTGEDVLQRAEVPWPGCSYDWRVTTLKIETHDPATKAKGNDATGSDKMILVDKTLKTRNTKPGKKRRIKLHEQAREKAKLLEAQKLKELQEQEKRTQRNREKKLKKRARERKKKQEAAAIAGAAPAAAADEGVDTDMSSD